MTVNIAYLGPEGTYTQLAALTYSLQLEQQTHYPVSLKAFPSISRAMQATANGETSVTIVPVENSTEEIQLIYSHPQALSQCQIWLETHLPQASLVPTRSTTEALQHLSSNASTAAISSEWAAQLYDLPVLAHDINDNIENCTKFWVLGAPHKSQGNYTSLAFSLPSNTPGALLKPLQIFAQQNINLSRIESRPTKRSLGDYLFFIDLEANAADENTKQALEDLANCTETLLNFGSYNLTIVTEDLKPVMQKYQQLKE